ncbi:uncharacterized protein LOC141649273 [Silene latifolia]|uniref:uncharacterized protein LOC141649273 n=1 Tax=Silene latifolia TaxID=37657 RepID=UPI003D77FCB4
MRSIIGNLRCIVSYWEPTLHGTLLRALFAESGQIILSIRDWNEQVELTKENVMNVPVWVKLHNLPLKFWGKCLPTIAGLVGKYLRSDPATEDKTRLGFARVLLEVPFGKALPTFAKFLDEEGSIVKIRVECEWKPVLCTECGVVQQTPVELPHKLQVTWNRDGSYQQVTTPAKPTVTLSRQEIIQAGQNSVGLFGLLETKVKPLSLNSVRANVCDGWSVSTNTSWHIGGRIWVLWNPTIFQVQFLYYSAQLIHMLVTEISSNVHFFCSMVYAFNDTTERKTLWTDLNNLASSISSPWIVCGDFNCVLSPSERLGGQTSEEEMEDFQACIDNCALIDSPAIGSFYTWNNKQVPSSRVYSRLDRALVNQEWLQIRPDSFAHFYNEGLFDHTPCIVQAAPDTFMGRRSFKYFNMWSQTDDFLPCVKQVWDQYWLDNIQTYLKDHPNDSAWIEKELQASTVYRDLQVL